MENSIDGYLRQLKEELKNCDRATVQDALSDAEEYLRNALENLRERQTGILRRECFFIGCGRVRDTGGNSRGL